MGDVVILPVPNNYNDVNILEKRGQGSRFSSFLKYRNTSLYSTQIKRIKEWGRDGETDKVSVFRVIYIYIQSNSEIPLRGELRCGQCTSELKKKSILYNYYDIIDDVILVPSIFRNVNIQFGDQWGEGKRIKTLRTFLKQRKCIRRSINPCTLFATV